MTKIDISIEMPAEVRNDYKYQSLYEKVCDYIWVCESDEESSYHWRYLKAMYEKLSKLPPRPATTTILEKLEPFILKHRSSDSGDTVEVDAEDMLQYYED